MSYIKDDNYVITFGWMMSQLHLKGRELTIYSIIYGFSQDGQSYFTGSLQYLAEWASCTKRQVQNVLADLVEKKLVIKKVYKSGGVRRCAYKCVKVPRSVDTADLSQTTISSESLDQMLNDLN